MYPLCSISFKRQKSLVRRCTRKSVSGSNVNKLGSTVVVMRPHCGLISAIKGNEGKQKDRLPACCQCFILAACLCLYFMQYNKILLRTMKSKNSVQKKPSAVYLRFFHRCELNTNQETTWFSFTWTSIKEQSRASGKRFINRSIHS